MNLSATFLAALLLPLAGIAKESQCYGTASNGRIEDSVKLPLDGPNFSAYSAVAATAGRTYLHSKVARIIEASYKAIAAAHPDVKYVYGETGWASGGRFRPHRTHQNGLSVDFFVPVRDANGTSVPLPTRVDQRFGYDLEFDASGRHGQYSIDFEAISEHLYQLHIAAKAQGAGVGLVIFDAPYLPRLFATGRGAYLRQNLPFMKGKPWVRHDEHYHVDFSVPCLIGALSRPRSTIQPVIALGREAQCHSPDSVYMSCLPFSARSTS
jgi:penicillin-insensitive murein endopeptidase